ncbi:cryptochrome/photolyase family protein [Rhodalgimonas zhirmunskyi]|uniref:DNA photolyase family protein n=1 Tax=Rhodalgimonas zhirmunskyi TaxID=2964767 RepID=A0AAJ1U898_9RHOB|nr:deoxyribodipyrimidine photo-lyase [Rhodoalgimonas zhirmunskyi]MDQ2092968.1 DNA photolyase family protein [Rhodoalgimonas zhirmunskyi]
MSGPESQTESGAKKGAIVWFRRDLRLADHRALRAACDGAARSDGPVWPVFIRDAWVDDLGAAAKQRLEAALEKLSQALEEKGSRLILRSGTSGAVLEQLASETGSAEVHWHRLYDPESRKRDEGVKSALKGRGLGAESHAGQLLNEPWTVETNQGGFYKVYTPFWKAVREREQGDHLNAPGKIPAPDHWPETERLEAWQLRAPMRRGAAIVAQYIHAGEDAARDRMHAFLNEDVDAYGEARDMVAVSGTSQLSDHLALGEISVRDVWNAGRQRMEEGKKGAEAFVKQLVWRDFAHHLMFHTPHILTDNWREGWDEFPWDEDERHDNIKAWKQGRTGIALVDAAMREMYVTGRMHNRARMVAASYLTKHLRVHWRVGLKWFEDCLTDWDPANNAMGWQWVAGSGPDASPYFRVFNPDTQAEKFDPKGSYRRRWIAEGQRNPPDTALSFFEAMPESWALAPGDARPAPIVGLKEGREAALAAYQGLKS